MTDWLSSLFTGLANAFLLVAMLIGLFGMVIPIFPGGVVIWLAALVYGIVFGISGWGWVFFLLITGLMIAGIIVDDLLMATSARKQGASWGSLAFAYLGGIAGTILLPPFGGLLGAPLVLYLSEYGRKRSRDQAWQVTRGLLVGWGWSFAARFGIGLVMIALWLLWVLTKSGA
ncbi:MAG: DUF456 domain-containing protein [Chloroflexi bacterium]|nr:DUF456 domain-containing protein [Chloroflexota bacterium]